MDAALQDPLVGQVLDGRYRVESRIARGGMASVYLAVDTRLDRTVAVKVMHAGLASDMDAVARFIREAKSAARLSHPNAVAVFDQGTDQVGGSEVVFLAMEYVEGRTLRDLLRERGRLTPRQALDILEPVLAALSAAHSAGIVHRDIKPENVLLADDGRVKVADFGLARAVSASTSHTATRGLLIGTVAYLAPEQVERGVADPRSDVYACGILLFEMLTGTKPYDGESAIQVAYRHVHDDVPPPSERVTGLSPELDRLVSAATSRDPDGRPKDASRLLADVVAVRRRLGVEALDHAGSPDLEQTLVVHRDRTNPTMVVAVPDADMLASGGDGSAAAASGPDTAAGAAPNRPGAELVGPVPAPSAGADVPRRRRVRRGPLAIIVLLLVAAGVGAWYVGAGPGSKVPAPSLLGLTAEQAEAKAGQAGLGVAFEPPEFSEDVAAGHVLRTDPEPRGSISKDGTITVIMSKGPERYTVPRLTGTPQDEAEHRLTENHLAVGNVDRRYDQEVPKGSVVSTEPAAGERLRRDTPVDLVVSRGREPIKVRNFTGKDGDNARERLTEKGFTVRVTERYDEEVDAGDVISQTPKSGTHLRGDTIRLVISKGPPLVEVPDVLDKKVGEAREILEDAGFDVATRGTQILNRVIVQSPPGGRQAPKGSTVTLTTV